MLTQRALFDELSEASARLVATAESLGDDVWTFRDDVSSWSPAEVVEHVVLVNRLGKRRLTTLSPKVGAASIADRDIPYLFYQGDEPMGLAHPSGEFPDRGAALHALEGATTDLIGALDLAQDLRTRGAIHPLFGLLDGVQWALFYAAHMDRHRAEFIGLARGYRGSKPIATFPEF